jgi:iron uptake system component EfeO
MKMRSLFLVSCFVPALACGGSSSDNAPKTEAQYRLDVVGSAKTYIHGELENWYSAVKDLQTAAPAPSGRGWDVTADKAAMDDMKAAWRRARIAYEHIEGALAPLFPTLDVSTDERYDGFLSAIKSDDDMFDDQGVTGMHAIERILYSDSIPATVVAFEQGLPGYTKAAFPATEQEATEFKQKLCARLVSDVLDEKTQFEGATDLDLAFVYQGTLDLIAEQLEKVDKAATGEEESRYAQLTMLDLHSNYTGNLNVYNAFKPWLLSKGDPGKDLDAKIMAGFDRLNAAYDAAPDPEKMPPPPSTWSATAPTDADRQSAFGQLYIAVSGEADADTDGSLASEMTKAGDLLGLGSQ